MSQIEVRILQQEYVLTCPEGQEEALMSAVSRVDADMERIRNTGKVRARERVGVLAAVNLAFENMVLEARTQTLQAELLLNAQAPLAEAPGEEAPPAESSPNSEISPDDMQALMVEVQAMLELREQELLQAQALIERLEAALETDSHLL